MSKTVRVYDVETKKSTFIPAAELGPGMVEAEVTGIGRVWIDAEKVDSEMACQHPPFSEEIRGLLRQIKAAIDEVYPMTLKEWEDGFRRDRNPEREIAIWLHIAAIYKRCTSERDLTRQQRQDYFGVILACSNSPKEHVVQVLELSAITREQADKVIEMFYPDTGDQTVS